MVFSPRRNKETLLPNNRHFFLSFPLIIILAGILTGNLCSAELDVAPYIQLRQTYNSNIFYTPDEVEDFITMGSVGVNLLSDGVDNDFAFNYQLDQLWFWENSDENVMYHTASANANLKLSRVFELFLEESFLRTAEPATAELTEREDRTFNTAKVVTRYKVRKLAFDAGYTNDLEMYDDIDTRDSREDIVSAIINYYYRWNVAFFVQFDRGWIDYDDEERSDGNFDEIGAGLNGNIAPRTTGQVKAGYLWQEYDLKTRGDFSGETLYADIKHAFSERSSIVIYARRTIEESFFADNDYYRISGGGFEYAKRLRGGLDLLVSGSYQVDEYPEEAENDGTFEKREDEIYSGGASLRFDLGKDVDAVISSEYFDYGSNFPENDYTGYRLAAQARLTF